MLRYYDDLLINILKHNLGLVLIISFGIRFIFKLGFYWNLRLFLMNFNVHRFCSSMDDCGFLKLNIFSVDYCLGSLILGLGPHQKQIYGGNMNLIESSYKGLVYLDLKKVNSHKAWRIVWLHMTKYPLLDHHIFTLLSFMVQRNKESRMEFLRVLLFYMYWIIQNLQFWWLSYNQAICFLV